MDRAPSLVAMQDVMHLNRQDVVSPAGRLMGYVTPT